MTMYKFSLSKATAGIITDYNGEQYLPLMSESYLTINELLSGVVSIQKYGEDSVISSDDRTFYIRRASTLELIKTIVAPRQIRCSRISDRCSHFTVSEDLNKIYCITSDTVDVIYLSIYDITSEAWEEHLLPTITSTYADYISYLIVDEVDNTVFVYTGYYTKMFKFSLSTFELLVEGTVGSNNSGVSFDGSYLYAMITSSNHSQVKKYDKNTLSILASTADTYYRSTSTVRSGEVFHHDGYLFVSSVISSSAYNIAKVRISNLVIVANTGDGIIASGRMCADDGRLFGVHSGATSGIIAEFDINTLAKKTDNIATVASYNNQVLIMPKAGVVFGGTQAALAQIERTYTVENYKNVKEII